MRRAAASAWALTALLLLSACGVPFPRYEPVPDEARRRELAAALVHPIGPVKMLLRAIVRVGAEESNLTLYAQIRPPVGVHVAAIGDLGSTVFEALRDGGRAEVLRASPLVPERVVLAIVDGLALAFLAPQEGRLALVRVDGVGAALHGGAPPGREVLLWPEARGDRLVGGEDGRLRSRARVEWRPGRAAGDPARPHAIVLEGATAEISASIEVLRIAPIGEAAPPGAGGR